MNRRTIDLILRENAETTTGVAKFGRGAKWHDNIDDVTHFPRVWIHDIRPTDTLNFHTLSTKYLVIGELCKPIDFDADEDGTAFETILFELTPVFQRFITNISRDSRNKGIGEVRRVELIHKGDANLAGFGFSFTIAIKEEIAYQCL
jgi:hypothetical protein